MLGSVIPKNEFLVSCRIVTCGYGNSGILRLSNKVFEFFNEWDFSKEYTKKCTKDYTKKT